MKSRLWKKAICVMGAICLFSMTSQPIAAAETSVDSSMAEMPAMITAEDLSQIEQYDTNGDGMVYAVIQPTAVGAAFPTSQNGLVSDNGVRLRKTASTSGTVLELMYKGEGVYINLNASKTGWFYLCRLKTGTWGYASTSLVLYT